MFSPRTIRTSDTWRDADGCKLYTIAADGLPVDLQLFLSRLSEVKAARSLPWPDTAHFAIFHRGSAMPYLVLCWWGNDNELFTSVSVQAGGGWIEQADRYSFCLYDLEIIWDERNHYVRTMDCAYPALGRYRESRCADWIDRL